MDKQVKEVARKKVGEYLKKIREDKGVSTYKMMKEGVRVEVLKSIEDGSKNYTIDNFLNYIRVVDSYFCLVDKEEVVD